MRRRLTPQGWILLLILIVIGPGEAFINGGIPAMADWFMDTFMMIPGIVVGLSFHEFAHAKVADLCGDPTPRFQGRVTLDPRAHVDIFGLVTLIFIHFGWGRPVMINPANFKHRRLDSILVGIAGVTMNFLLAVAFGGAIRLLYQVTGEGLLYGFPKVVGSVLLEVVIINISLMLFNLIPVPPLDGFGVVCEVFNLKNSKFFIMMYQYSTLILMMLILFRIPSRLISTPMVNIVNFIMAGIFKLPGWFYLL